MRSWRASKLRAVGAELAGICVLVNLSKGVSVVQKGRSGQEVTRWVFQQHGRLLRDLSEAEQASYEHKVEERRDQHFSERHSYIQKTRSELRIVQGDISIAQ